MAGNGTFELFFVAKIKANAPNGTVIGNQAVARSTEVTTPEPSDDPSTPANNDITNISVRRAPNLSQVTKTFVDNNGGAVRPGDTLTYTITIRNIGSQPARNVTVTDPVNARLTNVQAPGGTFANGTITWNSSSLPQLASIAPNTQVALTFTAVIDLQTPNNTVIPNQATVRTSDLPSPILSDDPNTPLPNDPTNVTVRASADLSNAQKTVRDINGGSVAPGDILEYTIVIRNRGNTNAFQARVTDPTPANTEFVSGSVRLNGVVIPDGGTNPLIQGVIVRSARSGTPNGVVIPDDGAPPDDEAATIVFRVRVRAGTAAGTRISNQGTVFANGQPPAPTTEAVVVVGGGPDLNRSSRGGTRTHCDA